MEQTESLQEEWEDVASEEILRQNLKSRMKRTSVAVNKNVPRKVTKKKVKKKNDKSVTCPVCNNIYADRWCLQAHMALHTNTELHPCSLCSYQGKTRKYLTSHIRRSHREPQHKCNVCGKMFHSPARVADHMRVHTGEKPFKCKVCGKAFRAKYTLDTHSYIHTNKKPFKCQYCEYACRDGSTLRKHHARHNGKHKNYKCTYCPKQYDTKAYLRDHVAEKHFKVDMRVHPCDKCDKKFKHKYNLKNHVRTVHDKIMICSCEICGHKLSSWHNLSAHLRSHINVRPFKCSYMKCKKRFKDKSALKRHEIIHWPDRQLACPVCDRHFARRTRLNKHMLLHGIQKSRQLYECDFCGMSYTNKVRLIRHIGKHIKTRNTYICDVCKFVTHRKKAIVMHIKYGHGPETDLLCKICNKKYVLHANLISHYYNYHNIKYKTIKEDDEPPVFIKVEPVEPIEPIADIEIDLMDIEKHEAFADFNLDLDLDVEDMSYSKAVLSEDITQSMCRKNQIGPETALDELFREHQAEKMIEEDADTDNIILDEGKEEYVRRRIRKMVFKARQKTSRLKQQERLNALEEMRQRYNDRIQAMTSSKGGKENLKIKFININRDREAEKEKTDHNENTRDRDSDVTERNTSNCETNVKDLDGNCGLNNSGDNVEIDKGCNTGNETADTNIEEENATNFTEGDRDVSDREEDIGTKQQGNVKWKINTHQCYICYKLFETRSKLLQHCQIHFDVCSIKCLKKCPLCEYVTGLTITRHLKLVHNVKIRLPSYKVNDKSTNSGKSRYYYNVNNKVFKEIEIIPSVSNLNKIAYVKIDKKNRELKDKAIAKTKLVKKGGEWIVEKERININEYALPEFDEDEIKSIKDDGASYLDRLQILSHIAKKKNVNMLFPCEHCDKICTAFSGLKLHSRKHENNPKPFKKKVWKHKLGDVKYKDRTKVQARNKSLATKNRFANPKPIVNKHKCDDKLKEFYENNIKGADIEFWQFLKIYNRMTKENITDFDDLENRTDFGYHEKMDIGDCINEISTNSATNITNVTNNYTNLKPKNKNYRINKSKIKNKYVRTIRISKREHLTRLEIIEKLREKIRESSKT